MITPLNDRVLLDVVKNEETTPAGLIIPKTARVEKTNKGKVIAIGPSPDIKVRVGDIVVYDLYAAMNVKDDGDDLILIKNESIFAIIN